MNRLRNLQALWCDAWWDGPVSGIALHEEREYWFRAIFDETADDWTRPRRFELVPLTDQELAAERMMHLAFEQVSTRYCFHLDKSQRFLKADRDKTDFWEKFPPRHNPFAEHSAVGWFEENDLLGWR